MSYNGSGTFQINTSGQPVVAGTVISATAFNALTADLATGLSTAITKDGQTTTTARIPFAAGISSTLTTDSSSVSTGSIITSGGVGIAKALNVGSATDSSSISTGSIVTAGGVGVAKNLYVGVNANVAGTLGVTGVATFSATPIYSSLTASSAVATDASKNLVSVTNTGTGNNVLATSPTLVTPALGTPASGIMTNVTGINYDGFKNRIINGAMVIDARNAGASVTPTADAYTLDRWQAVLSASSKFSVEQTVTGVAAPAGFTDYLAITSSSAYSITSTDTFYLRQAIEGFNTADFAWGTSSASSVTLSFWVRSSLTGTFGGAIRRGTGNIYVYPFTYTISVANTWEQKTVTIAGPTSTWNSNTTNGVGLNVLFGLGIGATYSGTAGSWQASDIYGATGATSVVGTNTATFYITGVQLEKGSTATSFDYRPYGTELALCQRYYFKIQATGDTQTFASSYNFSTTSAVGYTAFPVALRTRPTALEQSGTAANYKIRHGTTETACSSVPTFSTSVDVAANTVFTVASGLTAGQGSMLWSGSSSAYLAWSAEL